VLLTQVGLTGHGINVEVMEGLKGQTTSEGLMGILSVLIVRLTVADAMSDR
jgi:hypothetical protein